MEMLRKETVMKYYGIETDFFNLTGFSVEDPPFLIIYLHIFRVKSIDKYINKIRTLKSQ